MSLLVLQPEPRGIPPLRGTHSPSPALSGTPYPSPAFEAGHTWGAVVLHAHYEARETQPPLGHGGLDAFLRSWFGEEYHLSR